MHQDDVTAPKVKRSRDEQKSPDRQVGLGSHQVKKPHSSDGLRWLSQIQPLGSDHKKFVTVPLGGSRRAADDHSSRPHQVDCTFGSGIESDSGVFPVNVAIADKNPMVLAGLAALLNGDKRFNLLMMASDGERFLNNIGHHPVGMAIIGWDLPLLHARDILLALSKRPNGPKVVVYSGTKDQAAPSETLRLGGAGFVSKLSPPARLLEVFAAVAAGDMVFPFGDIQKVRSDPLAALTHRERDLLAALERGQSNAQLAREFGISVNTIKFHLRNLFGKLEVRNRTQAICHYLEMKR
jgi:two-component system nitrate/nitrite response regulator NarP